MNLRRSVWLCGIATATTMISVAALAQTTAGNTAPADERPATEGGSSEIVVTALKRSQSLQDVPASITAISGADLTQQGLTDMRDIARAIPNLVWGENFGTTYINIRGVGAQVASGANEPTVTMYVDGIALPRSDMATVRAVDLERIEVLRGPQGTLYGRNATGGAINFISPRPSGEFRARVEGSAGSRNAWGINGFINAPLANGVYLRVSGGREKQNGFVKVINAGQDIGGTDATYGRVALRVEPSADLTVDLAVRYDNEEAARGNQQLLTFSPIAAPDQQTIEPHRIIADRPYGGRNWTVVASGEISWRISDDIAFRSLTGYVKHNSHVAMDDDSTGADFFYTDNNNRPSESVSQEINLSGSTGNLDWLVGAYYFHENYSAYLPVIVPGPLEIGLGQTAEIENMALFADLTYSFSDTFKLNIGGRFNHEDNAYQEILTYIPGGQTAIPYNIKRDKFLPKIALRYEPNSDLHAYAQWSRGYKSGGVNYPSAGGTFFGLYGAEQLDAFEIGLKSRLFDRRLTANFAAYYYDYKGLQIDRNEGVIGVVVDNADATIYGIEADLRFEVTDDFIVSVAPSLQRARFKDFVSFDQVLGADRDFKGLPLTRAPDFSLNASVQYGIDLGGTLFNRLNLQANLVHTSTTILYYFNHNEFERNGPLTLIGLSASVQSQDKKTKLSAFVNNLTDQRHLMSGSPLSAGPAGYFWVGNYAPPRTWGVRLSREF